MEDLLAKAYQSQKSSAARRGVAWELEYWEWLQIWQESGHLHERGAHKGEWVMSRPGDKGPYAIGNVKIVRAETNHDESNKRRRTPHGEVVPSTSWRRWAQRW